MFPMRLSMNVIVASLVATAAWGCEQDVRRIDFRLPRQNRLRAEPPELVADITPGTLKLPSLRVLSPVKRPFQILAIEDSRKLLRTRHRPDGAFTYRVEPELAATLPASVVQGVLTIATDHPGGSTLRVRYLLRALPGPAHAVPSAPASSP